MPPQDPTGASKWWRGNQPGGIAWASLTPALIIPVVGNVIVPLAGVPLGHEAWSAAQFAVGLFFWPLVHALILMRLATQGSWPERLQPAVFVFVAPSVVGLAFAQFGAHPLIPWAAWGIAFFSLLVAATQWRRIAALPFAVPHWAMSFPLAAFTALTLRLGPPGNHRGRGHPAPRGDFPPDPGTRVRHGEGASRRHPARPRAGGRDPAGHRLRMGLPALARRALPPEVRRALRRWAGAVPDSPAPDDYERRLHAEQSRFDRDVNVHELPEIFHYWSNRYLAPKFRELGFAHPDEFFAMARERAWHASPRGTRRFVSIGAGNCDTEVRVAVARRLIISSVSPSM